jgi:hypothetical protein
MQDRVRMGLAGRPSESAGRHPEEWGTVAGGEVGAVVEAVTARSFLYEDPGSFRAGVAELLRALGAAGVFAPPLPA